MSIYIFKVFFVDFFLVLRLTFWVWSVSVSNAYKSNVTTYRWKRLEYETNTMSSVKKNHSTWRIWEGNWQQICTALGTELVLSIYRVTEQAVLYSIFWLVSETENCKECIHQHTWLWNQKGILMKTDSNHLWKKRFVFFQCKQILSKVILLLKIIIIDLGNFHLCFLEKCLLQLQKC